MDSPNTSFCKWSSSSSLLQNRWWWCKYLVHPKIWNGSPQAIGAGPMGHEGARAPSLCQIAGHGGTVSRRMTSDQQLLETSFSFVYNNSPPLQWSDVKFYTKQWHRSVTQTALTHIRFIMLQHAYTSDRQKLTKKLPPHHQFSVPGKHSEIIVFHPLPWRTCRSRIDSSGLESKIERCWVIRFNHNSNLFKDSGVNHP